MEIQIGQYKLENDVECKCIPDGFELFADAVAENGIHPDDFKSAYWYGDSIIVENDDITAEENTGLYTSL